jgi:hypothetical protein
MLLKKRDLIKEDTSEESVIKKVISKLKDVKERATSEIKETKALVRILMHAVKSYTKKRDFDLNEQDKKFIKEQSTDVIKNIIIMIVAIIPLPIPLTPFLVIFGKKLGIDLIPQEQEIPEKGKSKKEKVKESKKLNILITKEQYELLNEINEPNKNILQKLCSNQKENKPFCSLLQMREKLTDTNQLQLDISVETLFKYFRFNNVGMFPRIVELELKDEGRTVNYLKLISDFIMDDQFDDTSTKKILDKQRYSKDVPENLDDILKQARTLEHQKYEESFVGDHFGKKSTYLRLNYYCNDDVKETLFDVLTKIKSEERTLDFVFDKVTSCIQKSLTQGSYYLKADLVTTTDLKYEGEVIYPQGTYFEVKKMDPFIDSYLSEFFSIFKETEKIALKGEYVEIYNELIQRIFEWLNSNEDAQEYLDKVKSQIGGIIYEYQTIVPSEFIDLYWSNKGQRGCDEKRLSIRFRIKPGVDEIKTFRYNNSDELEPVVKKVPYNQNEKVICI